MFVILLHVCCVVGVCCFVCWCVMVCVGLWCGLVELVLLGCDVWCVVCCALCLCCGLVLRCCVCVVV